MSLALEPSLEPHFTMCDANYLFLSKKNLPTDMLEFSMHVFQQKEESLCQAANIAVKKALTSHFYTKPIENH